MEENAEIAKKALQQIVNPSKEEKEAYLAVFWNYLEAKYALDKRDAIVVESLIDAEYYAEELKVFGYQSLVDHVLDSELDTE